MDPLGESPWADAPAQSPVSNPTATGDEATGSSNKPSTSETAPAAAGGPRPSRLTPRRLVAQPTKLQAVEDDPLGPLAAGAASDAPPMPPQKEPSPASAALPVRTTMVGGQPRKGAVADPHRIVVDDDDDEERIGGRAPPPVQAAQPVSGGARGMGPPSVSIEQAAKPNFNITVGDPHKVGDLTSSHIVYSVRTKVCLRSTTAVRGRTAGPG